MRRAWRVLVAAAVLVVAMWACGDGGDEGGTGSEATCPAVQASDDPAVVVTALPLHSRTGPVQLTITRNGQPLAGAAVCFTSTMESMDDMAATGHATEVSPGVYEVRPNFEMDGTWAGTVTVTEKGRSSVAKPLTVEVGGGMQVPSGQFIE